MIRNTIVALWWWSKLRSTHDHTRDTSYCSAPTRSEEARQEDHDRRLHLILGALQFRWGLNSYHHHHHHHLTFLPRSWLPSSTGLNSEHHALIWNKFSGDHVSAWCRSWVLLLSVRFQLRVWIDNSTDDKLVELRCRCIVASCWSWCKRKQLHQFYAKSKLQDSTTSCGRAAAAAIGFQESPVIAGDIDVGKLKSFAASIGAGSWCNKLQTTQWRRISKDAVTTWPVMSARPGAADQLEDKPYSLVAILKQSETLHLHQYNCRVKKKRKKIKARGDDGHLDRF